MLSIQKGNMLSVSQKGSTDSLPTVFIIYSSLPKSSTVPKQDWIVKKNSATNISCLGFCKIDQSRRGLVSEDKSDLTSNFNEKIWADGMVPANQSYLLGSVADP
jgi:hypothetical protein